MAAKGHLLNNRLLDAECKAANVAPAVVGIVAVTLRQPSLVVGLFSPVSICLQGVFTLFRSASFMAAQRIFGGLGKLGVGLAIAGGIVNSALYNGERSDSNIFHDGSLMFFVCS